MPAVTSRTLVNHKKSYGLMEDAAFPLRIAANEWCN